MRFLRASQTGIRRSLDCLRTRTSNVIHHTDDYPETLPGLTWHRWSTPVSKSKDSLFQLVDAQLGY